MTEATEIPIPRDPPAARRALRVLVVPVIGRVEADDATRQQVEDRFHWPMVGLSVVFLALLLIEFLGEPEGWRGAAVDAGFAVVWLAFLVEFAIKFAIAESRFEYLRKNWLDVVIIAVPVLRPLRFAAPLAKMTRAVRLKGAGVKIARAAVPSLIGLKATESLLRRVGLALQPGGKEPEKMTRGELEEEVRRLRKLLDDARRAAEGAPEEAPAAGAAAPQPLEPPGFGPAK